MEKHQTENQPVMEMEEIFQKLDKIAEQLESRATSLEDSFRLYQEGMQLLKECSGRIDKVEKKMLQMNGDGSFCEL